MGKLTMNGKDITKPFPYNGKNVVKLTANWNNKVVTFSTTGTGGTPTKDYCADRSWITFGTNSYVGKLSTPARESAFLLVTTEILTSQFSDEHNLQGIYLPNVTKIGNSAFNMFSSAQGPGQLQAVILPEVITIGDTAFNGHPITCLEAPKLQTIGEGAFTAAKLTTLNLPEVLTINYGAFQHVPLTSLNLPKVQDIGLSAFSEAKLTTLNLPKVTTVGGLAFRDSPLTQLTMPEVQTINLNAFQSAKLTTLDLPKATDIASRAFQNSPLTRLNIPKLSGYGVLAFQSIVNDASTIVTIPARFNNKADKDGMFGLGHWDKITFLIAP